MRILRHLLRRRRRAATDTPTIRIRLPRHGPAPAAPTTARPVAEPAPDGAELAARDRLRAVLREVNPGGC